MYENVQLCCILLYENSQFCSRWKEIPVWSGWERRKWGGGKSEGRKKGRGTMYHAPCCRERRTTMTGSVTREQMRQKVFHHTLTVPRPPWISPSQRVWAKGCAIQAKLTAIAVNLKRIAALITERDGKTGRPAGAFPGLPALLSHYFCSCVLRRSFVLFSLILLDFQWVRTVPLSFPCPPKRMPKHRNTGRYKPV